MEGKSKSGWMHFEESNGSSYIGSDKKRYFVIADRKGISLFNAFQVSKPDFINLFPFLL